MRTRMLAAASVLLAACAGSEPQPKLSISPSGSQTITGPVLITASPIELANEVTWSLSGSGTLSNTTGHDVTYRPPVPAVATPATVTATARGQTATVTFTLQTPQQAKVVIGALGGDVNVTYDQFDIPHIFCATDTDCFAVQGYIQAQDRLFQMDLFRRTAEGRLAELVGAVEEKQDEQFLALFITRDLQRIEDKLYAALPADIKAKVDAYAAGVNAYLSFLAAHPTLMPQEYAQLPGPPTPADIPQWRGQDTLAIGRLQQFQLSETIEKETGYGLFALTFGPAGVGAHPDAGRFAAYVLAAQPVNGFTLSAADPDPAPAPAAVAPGPVTGSAGTANALGAINSQMRELNGLFGSIRAESGSNNWVVDGAHSATGFAMVANDPHLPLQFPPLFHLAAMTSADGKLNVTGGSFPGVPGALVGRGTHVGWGVTVVGYDVTDLYQEHLTNCGVGPLPCNTVSFNGADVPLAAKTYQIKVKGEANPRSFTALVVPHHGPILNFDPAHQSAISMRWTGHEVTADLQGFLGLIEASAVGTDADVAPATTAFAALRNYAIGAQNFVLADDAGHIGYDPHALVPKRDWSFAPATATQPGHQPWFPLDGVSGTAEWGRTTQGDTACAANPPPSDCWVADNQLPRGVDPGKGYFATANSDPAGYTGHTNSPFGSSVDPTLYPFLSFDWSDPSDIRYARIAELLKGKTAVGKVSLADMQAVQSDHAMLLARIFETRGFYPEPTTVNQPAYTAARQLLQAWATTPTPYDCPTGLTTSDPKSAAVTDTPTLTNSAACLLFHTFLNKLIHNVFDDDAAVVSATTHQSFSADTGPAIRALVLKLLPNPTATGTFCDDVNADASVKTAKTCATQVVTALSTAFATLANANGTDTKKWLWGRVHTLTSVSPAAPLIANGFSAGPFARPGGALTVDVGNPSGSQSSPLAFAYGSGSNVRHISVMDPNAATAQVKMQLPGPERDAPFGVFSSTPDLLGQYVQNQYFDFLHGHQIDNKGVSAQGFSNK